MMNTEPERQLLKAIDSPREPATSFAASLLATVTEELSHTPSMALGIGTYQQKENGVMTATALGLPVPYPRPLPGPTAPGPRAARTKHRPFLLAAAAILCLMLGGVSVLYYQSMNDPEPVRLIPAAVVDVDDIPANSAAAETLFATTLSSDQFPLDSLLDWDKSLVSYMEMEPGVSYNTDHPAFFCCVGISVLAIIDGELTFENSGPMLIYRSGGDTSSPELVEPDTPVIATTGDTVIQRMSVPGNVTNSSAITTTFLAGYVYYHAEPPPPGACCWPEGYSQSEVTWAQTFTPSVETEGPVSVSWERIAFEPGQDIVIDTAASQTMLATIKDGRLQLWDLAPDVTLEREQSMPFWGPRSWPLDVLNGAEFAMVNESDAPAVLYVFSFNPPGEGTS